MSSRAFAPPAARRHAGGAGRRPRAGGASARLRFGHVHPPKGEVTRGVARAAEVLRERTGGRLRMDNFPSSQLGASGRC
jgi:TRAP-type C4-dicarboxylate transport system substrate-binding protein